MKKLITAFFILTMGISLNAQDSSLAKPQILPSFDEQEITGEKIQKRDLPEAVRESLKAPDYAGWKVESAYKALVTDQESPESAGLLIYIVKLRRKQEREMIKFDKEGKRLY
jgi:hypothetical protein